MRRARRRATVVLASVVVVAVAVGCTHDWSLPLAVATPDAATADVATVVVDGSPRPPDAGFSCVGARLCDTFDDAPLSAVWDDVRAAAGGRAIADPFAGAPSPPNVLLAERSGQETGAETAFVAKVLQERLGRVQLALDLLPEALDPDAAAAALGIIFQDGTAEEHKVRLLLRRESAQLQELGPTAVLASHPMAAVPEGVWSHVTMSVEAGGKVVVAVGGRPVVDVALSPGWAPSTRTRIIVGINFVQDARRGAIRIRADNVRLDGS